MKYRHRPIVVNAVGQADGTILVHWPGRDIVMSIRDFNRDFEPAPPNASLGCSCSFDRQREVLPNDTSVGHTKGCLLANY